MSLKLDGLVIPDYRVVSRVDLDVFFASQNIGVRINGTLPLGLLRRCAALLDVSGHTDAAHALRERSSIVRTRLDDGITDAAGLISARAEAATLALNASAALVDAEGGRGLLRGSHPERPAREAVFTLVAASRPQLKDLLVARFSSG